jgi:hypothetical protein
MNPIGRFFIVGCAFYIGFSVFLLDRPRDVAMLTPAHGANRRAIAGRNTAAARADNRSLIGDGRLSVFGLKLASSVARLPWYLWLPDHGRKSSEKGRRHNPRFFGARP